MTGEPESGGVRPPAQPAPDTPTLPTLPLGLGALPADPGQLTLGRYQISSEVGKGAMGVVYQARDPLLERTVAIKTINLAMDPEEMAQYEARFYQEARAAGGLNHPNIVTVYDIGRSGNVAFMAMEFLQGREVRAMLVPGKPLPVDQAVGIAAQAAEGLAFAHEHGVIHRDIKPANLMVVRDGLVKIMDFGIARMRSGDVLTRTGMVLGSPKYMSPEQVVGKRADHRTDLFSLGVVLYEMLTGRAPFEGESMTAIMLQTLNFSPEPPGTLNPQVPAVLDFIVAKMLAKNPDERYQEARELVADLRACLGSLQGEGAGPHSITRGPQPVPETVARDPAAERPDTPRSRRSDLDEDASTIRGISPVFDSLSAIMRLAAATGAGMEFEDYARTRRTPALRDPAMATSRSYGIAGNTLRPAVATPPAPGGLNRFEKLVFGAALVAAALLALIIVSG